MMLTAWFNSGDSVILKTRAIGARNRLVAQEIGRIRLLDL